MSNCRSLYHSEGPIVERSPFIERFRLKKCRTTEEMLSVIRTRHQRFFHTPHANIRSHTPRRCMLLTTCYCAFRPPVLLRQLRQQQDLARSNNTIITSRAWSHHIIPQHKIENERRTSLGTSAAPADDVGHATRSFTPSRKPLQQQATRTLSVVIP